MAISSDTKILTFVSTITSEPNIQNINLEDLKHCNIIKHYNKDKDGIVRLKSLDLELIFKLPSKQKYDRFRFLISMTILLKTLKYNVLKNGIN